MLPAGSAADKIGIVLSGQVNTVYEDVIGGRSIIGTFGPGQLFGDAFACSAQQVLPVSVVADTDSTVVLISIDRILHIREKDARQ